MLANVVLNHYSCRMDDQISKAIWFAGGVSALARQLGVSHSDVSKWKHGRKPVPYKHRITIEEMTNGAIRAVDWQKSA